MRQQSAGLGHLLFNGFLVNRFGELTWHGETEVWPVVVPAGTAGAGPAVRRPQAVLAREAFGFDPHGSRRLSMRRSRTVADVALVLLTVGLFVVFAAVLKGLERL
ncbi:MAG: hypothetical protein SYR96_16210 [Actinomycetota bacterium]|nr:hypothetical protein [Actinomycetota bacterium]